MVFLSLWGYENDLGGTDRKMGWEVQEQRHRFLLNAPWMGWDTWRRQEFAQFQRIVRRYKKKKKKNYIWYKRNTSLCAKRKFGSGFLVNLEQVKKEQTLLFG